MIRCPSCNYEYTVSVQDRNGDGRAYRQCASCRERFATQDVAVLELTRLQSEVAKLAHQNWVLTETEAPVIGASVPVLGTVSSLPRGENRIKWR